MKKILAIVASAVLFGGIAGATVLGIAYVSGVGTQIEASADTQTETETQPAVSSDQSSTASETKRSTYKSALDVSDIVEDAMPELVSITNTMVVKQQGYSNIFDYIYGGGATQEYEVPASGSGVILKKTDDELLIVTNNHVVEDSKELSVTFVDGTTVDAAIKGTNSNADIAVIAIPLSDIPEETMNKIKVAKLHDSEDLKPGQGVIAIGNALGYGQTVTVGYISALDREITAEDTTYSNLIQVDAAINPGNSGGALLNMDGELIGINVAKLANTSVEGIGYSIPIYKVNQLITELSNAKTKVEVAEEDQGRLGIYMNTVSEQNAQALGIPAGVIVRGFSDEAQEGYTDDDLQESPAKNAGIMKNDIITQFDGQSVSSAEDLASLVKYYEKGSTVDITVQRLENGAYTEKTITVTLGSKQDPTIGGGTKSAGNSKKQAGTDQNAGNAQNETGESSDGTDSGNDSSSDEEIYDMFKQFLDQYK